MTVIVDEEQLARTAKKRELDPRTLEIARRLFIDNEKPKRAGFCYVPFQDD